MKATFPTTPHLIITIILIDLLAMRATADDVKEKVDPFAEHARAAELLLGVWQYTADFSKVDRTPIYYRTPYQTPNSHGTWKTPNQPAQYLPATPVQPQAPPAQALVPAPTLQRVPSGYPPAQTQAVPTQVAPQAPAASARKLSSNLCLDLQAENVFRMEVLLADHTSKSCHYVFLEGKWSLRGRLLVLSFAADGLGQTWSFLIERLSAGETAANQQSPENDGKVTGVCGLKKSTMTDNNWRRSGWPSGVA